MTLAESAPPVTRHFTGTGVPEHDSACTARLYAAGAVLMGKLATHEFATGGPAYDLPWPPACNPWLLDRFPGGSSSGSGAAVAAGLVPGALGQRYRWLDSPASRFLWRGRSQAHLWPG